MKELLRVENLFVSAGDKELLHGINLTVNKGETHVIMGTNGAGKSTLMHSIMGNPAYEVTKGAIFFEGENIIDEDVDKRAKRGLFLSFQSPVSVSGITMENFLRTAKTTITEKQQRLFPFKRELKQCMEELDMNTAYAERYLNEGFSGGERKKSEILQMRVLNPKLAMLDETDSGLDIDAVRIVSKNVAEFHNEENALIIITHHNQILQFLTPDIVHIMIGGKLVESDDASLIDLVEEKGFEYFRKQVSS